MSSNRRPGKVRVFSSGTGEPAPQPTPSRRRSDRPAEEEVLPIAPAKAAPAGGLVQALITVVLFLFGCFLGGALFVLVGLVPGAS